MRITNFITYDECVRGSFIKKLGSSRDSENVDFSVYAPYMRRYMFCGRRPIATQGGKKGRGARGICKLSRDNIFCVDIYSYIIYMYIYYTGIIGSERKDFPRGRERESGHVGGGRLLIFC